MEEKEKKPERRSVPEKGLKRNKTTISLKRNKMDKGEKTEIDRKPRKSVAVKKSDGDKKNKTNGRNNIRTEGNEKKENLKKNTSRKELSKSTAKTLTK